MESEYTKQVLCKFETSFPNGWIEDMDWTSPKKKKLSFKQGIETIELFREDVVVQFSKMILSGNHLVRETLELKNLQELIGNRVEEEAYYRTLESKLRHEYQLLLHDLLDILCLVGMHISQTKSKFLPSDQVISGNFITFERNREDRHRMVVLMDMMCDSCLIEYHFSYDESYIHQLVLLRQCLKDAISKLAGEICIVFNAALNKVELLLCKLSAFSENSSICYYHDFQLETIQLQRADSYPSDDFRFLFQKYLKPSELSESLISEWQQDSLKDNVSMWQLAFLMRYYTKQTRNIEQINNLLQLAERHHKEYKRGDDKNVVNNSADRSFWNYMYNSRFSFLCQHDKEYTYGKLKTDLKKIESIQAETFIKNYHPYQSALDFTIKLIEAKISDSEKFEDISVLTSDLQYYLKKYKDNVVWCKKHQPYLMQLRFHFSSIKMDGCDFKTFCPSSFCRPLHFKELDEKLFSYQGKVAYLSNVANNQFERKMLFEAKEKINNMERRNMEHMGLFASLTTFLVGLLSIFIGNNGEVSITEKMRYVIALGLILLVFVCVGYFFVRGKNSNVKSGVFGFLLGISCVSIMFICRPSNNCENDCNVKKERKFLQTNKDNTPKNIRHNQTTTAPQETK